MIPLQIGRYIWINLKKICIGHYKNTGHNQGQLLWESSNLVKNKDVEKNHKLF